MRHSRREKEEEKTFRILLIVLQIRKLGEVDGRHCLEEKELKKGCKEAVTLMALPFYSEPLCCYLCVCCSLCVISVLVYYAK